ncbi:MAG: S8 family serine peptidase [Lactobacillus sp.]
MKHEHLNGGWGSRVLLAVLLAGQIAGLGPSVVSANTNKGTTHSVKLQVSNKRLVNKTLAKYLKHAKKRHTTSRFQPDQKVKIIVQLNQNPLIKYRFANRNNKAAYSLNKTTDQAADLKASQTSLKSQISDKIDHDASFGYSYTNVFNGFAVTSKYKNLAKIKKLANVKTAFVSATYAAVPTLKGDGDSAVNSNEQMVGLSDSTKYQGAGTVVAVLDTGLDTSHPAFATNPATAKLTEASIAKVFPLLSAHTRDAAATADATYHSAKVPYTFDYGNNDTNVNPGSQDDAANLDHGTHVSGIAVGDEVNGEGKVVFRGVAPQAQLVSMKVFDDTGTGATDANILAALDDAYKLGVDVINMSLGSPAGFTNIEDAQMNQVYSNLRTSGVNVMISAGNDTNASQHNTSKTDLPLASEPDDGIVGSPSTYLGATSVASADNTENYANYFKLGDQKIFYADTSNSFTTLTDSSLAYVVVPGNGTPDDFKQVDVKDKVALVQRGGLAFTNKIANAKAAGAKAILVYDNTDEPSLINMATAVPSKSLPAAFISQADGKKLLDASDKTLTPVATPDVTANTKTAGQISDFSSEGVTPDLQLKPEITAPGGNIWSSVPTQLKKANSYANMSGTSMASPHMAGLAALMKEYLNEQFPSQNNDSKEKVANDLLLSTAQVIKDANGNATVSPRRQGAGLANIAKATTSPAYLYTDTETGKPLLNLGDDPAKRGSYTMSFHIKNMTDKALTYETKGTALVPNTKTVNGQTYMAASDQAAQGDWSGDNTIEVAPYEDKKVSVTYTLGDQTKAYLDQKFTNGGYVEGFVGLKSSDSDTPDLSIPFLAFYSDWNQAPMVDGGSWLSGSSSHAYTEAGSVFKIGGNDQDIDLGLNLFDNNQQEVTEDEATLSPNGDGYYDSLDYFSLAQLRASKLNSYSIKNASRKEVYSDSETDVPKSFYYATASQWLTSSNPAPFSGLDSQNKALPDGQYTYTAKTTPVYNGTAKSQNKRDSFSFKFNIDTTAPDVQKAYVSHENGKTYLNVAATDNENLMAARLYAVNAGKTDLDQPVAAANLEGKNKSKTFKFDITNATTKTFKAAVLDWGYNEKDADATVPTETHPAKAGSLTVNYLDQSGKKLAKSQVVSGNVDDPFNVKPITIAHYKYNHASGKTSGKLTQAAKTVTFVYDHVTAVKSAKRVKVTAKAGATVYDDYGANAKATGKKLKAKTTVKVLKALKVGKTVWYQLGKKSWIKASATNNGITKVSHPKHVRIKLMTKLYRGYGFNRKATGKSLKKHAKVKVSAAYQVDGVVWYGVGKNLWIHAKDAK